MNRRKVSKALKKLELGRPITPKETIMLDRWCYLVGAKMSKFMKVIYDRNTNG